MANKNFVVHNGLTVGSLTIDAASGNLTTSGVLQSSGNLTSSSLALTSTFTQGDSVYKMNQYLLYGTTTGNVEVELYVNNQANLRVPISSNVAMSYQVTVTARSNTSGAASGWDLKGVAQNVSGTVSDVGDLYYVAVARSDANLEVDARADNTTKSLDIYATGVTGETIKWLAVVKTIEVIG